MAQSGYDAIIVGGGHNGLVAAFYLARAGRRVLLLERRAILGGACVTEELFEGYKISTCAYVMWKLEQKIRDDMGLDRRGLKLNLVDPAIFFPYEDGRCCTMWLDMAKTQAEIARFNRKDAEAYADWVAMWGRVAEVLTPYILTDPPSLDEVMERAKSLGAEADIERLLTSSLVDLTGAFFEDERVKAMVVYVQDIADPYAPGSAWTEAYFQIGASGAHGFYVVTGGMGAITQKMAEACPDEGVEIRTDAEVARVIVKGGRAAGVRLQSGEEFAGAIVLSNADPKRTYRTLFDPEDLPGGFRKKVEGLKTGTGYLKFHAVMSNPPDVSGHLGRAQEPRDGAYILIAPSLDHYARAGAEMRRGEPCSEPICHLQVPTDYDRTLTARDGHICSIWALYAPPKLSAGTWEAQRQEVGEGLIDYVTRFIPNFKSDIREWMLMTPFDIETRVGITDGAIRHLDVVPSQFLNQRPGYKGPIEGFYLCGSGTHPAGEVTGAPGHNAAHFILHERQAV